jgi:hypothetical protein
MKISNKKDGFVDPFGLAGSENISLNLDQCCGSGCLPRIPDPDFFPIPDPGVKKAPDPGSGSATLIWIPPWITDHLTTFEHKLHKQYTFSN